MARRGEKRGMFCPLCGFQHNYFRYKNPPGKLPKEVICCQSNKHHCEKCGENFPVRSTVIHVSSYPAAYEILQTITDPSNGWPYKLENADLFLERDRAGMALVYLGAMRISEMLRINTNQFDHYSRKTMVIVKRVAISKRTPTSMLAREREVWLPLPKDNENTDDADRQARLKLSKMVIDWSKKLGVNSPFFPNLDKKNGKPVRRFRAYQIISKLTGKYCHYFRGAGENFLYDAWNYDTYAVSDYLKVDIKTLQTYIHTSHKHGAV